MPKDPSRFKGLLTNVDLKDVPSGYMVQQTNIGNYRPGRLDVRKGIRYLKDTWGLTVSGTASIIAAYGFIAPNARWVVMENSDGAIKAIRDGATQSSLATGLNTFQRIACCQDQYGSLIVVNGIERGYRWDGVASTPDALGVTGPIGLFGDGPASTPWIETTLGAVSGNLANSSRYYCAYRYVDRDGIPSSIGGIREFTTDAGSSGTKITWHEGPAGSGDPYATTGSTESRVVNIEFWRSAANDGRRLYRVHEVSNATWIAGAGSSWDDDISDADLLASSDDDTLDIFTQDGLPYARRFEPPPTNKPFIALHQDVMFYYGRVFYTTGTIAATNGNGTITGTGTSLRTEMNGWHIRIGSDTVDYTISAINEGANTATITPVYAGSTGSGKTFVLSPHAEDEAFSVRFSVKGEPESCPVEYAQRIQSSSAGPDVETGVFSLGPSLYFFNEQTYYQASFSTNPVYDMAFSPAVYRGAVNDRCVIAAEGVGYAADQRGIYSFGGGFKDITTAKMRDFFDANIKWTAAARKHYFLSYEPHQRVLRFHVQLTTDSDTRPRRAVCYNITSDELWLEEYEFELCGGCIVDVSGKQRLICGGEFDNAILMFEDYADGGTAAFSGTATGTGSASTAFVDSGASFTTDAIGQTLRIISGTGEGEERTVTARPSGTALTLSSALTWDTTSAYQVGGEFPIDWNLRTGTYELATPQQGAVAFAGENSRELRMQHIPTSTTHELTLNLYKNRSASADASRSMGGKDAAGLVDYRAGANIIIDMSQSRLSGSDEPGYTTVELSGVVADSSSTDRYVQLDITGQQETEAVALTALDMIGFA